MEEKSKNGQHLTFSLAKRLSIMKWKYLSGELDFRVKENKYESK